MASEPNYGSYVIIMGNITITITTMVIIYPQMDARHSDSCLTGIFDHGCSYHGMVAVSYVEKIFEKTLPVDTALDRLHSQPDFHMVSQYGCMS